METIRAWLMGLRYPRKHWKRYAAIGIALLLCTALSYDANNRLSVTYYTYGNAKIPDSFDGYCIVHLSDLHNKVFYGDNDPLVDAIAEQKPDLIVMTGDMIHGGYGTSIEKAMQLIARLPEIAPTYFVTGNHEYYVDAILRVDFLNAMRDTGVTVLCDEWVSLESAQGECMSLIGVDDQCLQSDVLKQLATEAGDSFKLLLAHEPHLLDTYYAESGVDLVFSGHAHGGQIRIPFTSQGLYAPDQGFFPTMTEGLHQVGETTMYISRGLGNSGFPQRVFNRPELVVVELDAN